MVLYALEAADWLTKHYPGSRVFGGEVKNLLARPNLVRAEYGERLFQGTIENVPSRAGLAQHVGDRYPYPIKTDLGNRYHEAHLGGDRYSRARPVHQDKRYLAILHPCRADEAGCGLRVVHEPLRPIKHEAVSCPGEPRFNRLSSPVHSLVCDRGDDNGFPAADGGK